MKNVKNYDKYVFNKDILKENCGFPPPDENDEPRAYEMYMEWDNFNRYKIGRQRPRFEKFLSETPDHKFLSSKKLKKMVRKGVPPEYRGKVWFILSGGKRRMTQHKELFGELILKAKRAIRKKDDREKLTHIEYINNDIERTFPEIEFFRTQENLDRLRNILLAYSIYKPEIGYCQGLNFVAGIFLYFMNSEEKAFWTLDSVLSDYLPHDLYDPTLNGVYCESYVLYKMVETRLKKVHNILSKMDFKSDEYAIFATQWFMCLFLNNLPLEAALRIMDSFMMEGNKIIYRTALTVLQLAQADLEKMTQKGQVISFMKEFCMSMYNIRKLMKRGFRIRNFSKKTLKKFRDEFRENQRLKQSQQSK